MEATRRIVPAQHDRLWQAAKTKPQGLQQLSRPPTRDLHSSQQTSRHRETSFELDGSGRPGVAPRQYGIQQGILHHSKTKLVDKKHRLSRPSSANLLLQQRSLATKLGIQLHQHRTRGLVHTRQHPWSSSDCAGPDSSIRSGTKSQHIRVRSRQNAGLEPLGWDTDAGQDAGHAVRG
jgi:hypothetical protein